MATAKQIESNRLNAQKSTGPKTEEGKAASALNALTHGLSGQDAEAPGLISLAHGAYERLLEEFRNEFRPSTFQQESLIKTLAIESVRIDRCRRAGFQLEAQLSSRAKTSWAKDRLREAEVIYAKLHKDPARYIQDLEATSHGCFVMMDRWELLQSCLIKQGEWTDAQRSIALDLRGIPLAMRNGENDVDPETDDLTAARLELCETELDRLSEQCDVLKPGEEFERARDEEGVFLMLTKPGTLLERYEAAADRRYDKALGRLLASGCKSHPTPPKPASPPAPKPIQAVSLPQIEAEPALPVTMFVVPAVAPVVAVPPAVASVVAVPAVAPVAVAASAPVKFKPASKMNRRQRRAMAAQSRRSQ